jgi:hypothetical protein
MKIVLDAQTEREEEIYVADAREAAILTLTQITLDEQASREDRINAATTILDRF